MGVCIGGWVPLRTLSTEMTWMGCVEDCITEESCSRNPGQSFGQSACAIFGTIFAVNSRTLWSSSCNKCNIACRICCFCSCGRNSNCGLGIYRSLDNDHECNTYPLSIVNASLPSDRVQSVWKGREGTCLRIRSLEIVTAMEVRRRGKSVTR